MEIVKLKKEEDLELVKSLVDYKEYFDSDNILWDKSVKCIANNGDLLGFAIIKPNSLIDFFGGEIPAEEGVDEEEKYWVRDDVEQLKENQYEVLFYVKEIGNSYLNSDNITDISFQHILSGSIEDNEKGRGLYQVLWSKTELPDLFGYLPFNNIVYINLPIMD